ncbi:nuclear transport factor 2 family protein [Novosphingobium sp.]|uniref:nuclear transport factor 2 family protein n=1 Tax=Novosphingobium sp. TaxID=1874826 RepID=UPI00261D8F16|nr:nuclear transport factor 2 family protein [Novosphingobium sp.]
MRLAALAALALLAAPAAAQAKTCKLTPKQVVTQFLHEFYIEKKVRSSFEKWVDPGYIQHNPYAQTGREAAIAFLTKFVEGNPGQRTKIHRVIADGNLVAAHSHGWQEDGTPEQKRGFAVVDMFRVQGCKVMEHWDVISPVPETSANTNTMF